MSTDLLVLVIELVALIGVLLGLYGLLRFVEIVIPGVGPWLDEVVGEPRWSDD